MWLENEKVREIDTVVYRGEPKGLARIFSELFREEKPAFPPLASCPSCGKKLIAQALPYLEYFVKACPDRHGVWMGPEVFSKFRAFVREQMNEAARKAMFSRFFWILIAALIGIFYLVSIAKNQTDSIKNNSAHLQSVQFKPFALKSFPAIQESFEEPFEKQYFSEWAEITEKNIAGRLALEQDLEHSKRESFDAAIDRYQHDQENLLTRLKEMEVPEKLEGFHARIMRAIEAQIIFYTAFAQEKSRNPSMDISEAQGHPSLKVCMEELLQAYETFTKLYPYISSPARELVEERITWMNVL